MLSCDCDINVENEFSTALALFKSGAGNSKMKLREMLLMSIARQKKLSGHDQKIPCPISENENVEQASKKKNFIIQSEIENFENRDGRMNLTEIPTISIPDEEYIDVITCKVCDGIEIGPFTLLECQDCLDAYHPLCHQPPVVDIDVYDPRLVWRCSKCTDIDEQISSVVPLPFNSLSRNENISNNYLSNMRLIVEDTTKESDCSKNNRKHVISKNITKEEYSSLLGNSSRKRIGSKLSVSRANSKS